MFLNSISNIYLNLEKFTLFNALNNGVDQTFGKIFITSAVSIELLCVIEIFGQIIYLWKYTLCRIDSILLTYEKPFWSFQYTTKKYISKFVKNILKTKYFLRFYFFFSKSDLTCFVENWVRQILSQSISKFFLKRSFIYFLLLLPVVPLSPLL